MKVTARLPPYREAATQSLFYVVPLCLCAFVPSLKKSQALRLRERRWMRPGWLWLCTRPGPLCLLVGRLGTRFQGKARRYKVEKRELPLRGGNRSARVRPLETGEVAAGASLPRAPGAGRLLLAFVVTRKRPDLSEEPAGPLPSPGRGGCGAGLNVQPRNCDAGLLHTSPVNTEPSASVQIPPGPCPRGLYPEGLLSPGSSGDASSNVPG